jgi:hypothetical protein
MNAIANRARPFEAQIWRRPLEGIELQEDPSLGNTKGLHLMEIFFRESEGIHERISPQEAFALGPSCLLVG